MTKSELFALFAKYSDLRDAAVYRPDLFDRAEQLDDVLQDLLSELAKAAKE